MNTCLGTRPQLKTTGTRYRINFRLPCTDAGRIQAVQTLVHPGPVPAVVDQLVLAAQLVVEDGGVMVSHVVAVPVRSKKEKNHRDAKLLGRMK